MTLTIEFINAVRVAERRLTKKILNPGSRVTEQDEISIEIMKRIQTASSSLTGLVDNEEESNRTWLNRISGIKSRYLDIEASIRKKNVE